MLDSVLSTVATPVLALIVIIGFVAAVMVISRNYIKVSPNTVAVLSGLNLSGRRPGKWTQQALSASVVLGLAVVIVVGLMLAQALHDEIAVGGR